MVIKELCRPDIDEIINWSTDESIKDWIGIDNWVDYFDFVSSVDNYLIFGIWQANTIIGELSAEVTDNYISITLIIKPELQGNGLGAKALNLFCENIQEIMGIKLESVHAYISPDNQKSITCFEKAGFVNCGIDEDGFLFYNRSIPE